MTVHAHGGFTLVMWVCTCYVSVAVHFVCECVHALCVSVGVYCVSVGVHLRCEYGCVLGT